MEPFLEFVRDYWWLVFVFGGMGGGWISSVARYNEKRRRDKIELARIKAGAEADRRRADAGEAELLTRTLTEHDDVDRRWFAYEVDLATIIETPMMTDLREPLTVAFHRAKALADDLRPTPDRQLNTEALAAYSDAVREYTTSFNLAEREARRRRQSDFSPVEREALERARKLIAVAMDSAATPAERQSAYRAAARELEGIIAVPEPAAVQLEQQIALALEAGGSS